MQTKLLRPCLSVWVACLTAGIGVAPLPVVAQSTNELLYAESGRRALLNPHANPVHSGPTDRLLSMLYEPLFRTNSDSEDYENVLASRITPTPSKTVGAKAFLIDLKKNVRWHNGTAFTARDVVFTYTFIRTYGRNTEDRAEVDRTISRLEQNGGNPLQLYVEMKPGVKEPRDALRFYVIPENRFTSRMQPLNPALTEAPVGTGPFKWGGDEGDEPRLLANESYHETAKAVLSAIISKEYTDASTVAAELTNQGSRVGLVVDLPTSQFGTVEANASVVVMERVSSYKIHLLAIRQPRDAQSLLANLRVRQALVMAVDRGKMLRTRFSEKGKLIDTPYSPNSPYSDASFEPIPYNAERAKQIIAEAGGRGRRLRLLAKRTTSINKQRDDDILADLRDQLTAVGFNVQVTQVTPDVYDRMKLGEEDTWDVALATQEFSPSHDISWFYHSRSIRNGGTNYMAFRDPQADSLFYLADRTEDNAERLEYLRKVGVLIAKRVPAVFLVNEEPVYAYKRKYDINKDDVDQFDFFTYAHRWRLRPRR